jgi:hypothetical protein
VQGVKRIKSSTEGLIMLLPLEAEARSASPPSVLGRLGPAPPPKLARNPEA